jgi:hypothetical protein
MKVLKSLPFLYRVKTLCAAHVTSRSDGDGWNKKFVQKFFRENDLVIKTDLRKTIGFWTCPLSRIQERISFGNSSVPLLGRIGRRRDLQGWSGRQQLFTVTETRRMWRCCVTHNIQKQPTVGRRLSAPEGKAGFFVEYENMDRRQEFCNATELRRRLRKKRPHYEVKGNNSGE